MGNVSQLLSGPCDIVNFHSLRLPLHRGLVQSALGCFDCRKASHIFKGTKPAKLGPTLLVVNVAPPGHFSVCRATAPSDEGLHQSKCLHATAAATTTTTTLGQPINARALLGLLFLRRHAGSADMHFTWSAWHSRLALFTKFLRVGLASVLRENPCRKTTFALLCGKTPDANFRQARVCMVQEALPTTT